MRGKINELKKRTLKDFEIDENPAGYLALHPMASMKQPSLVAEHFELLTEDEDQGLSDSDNSAASQSSGDEHSNENRKFKKKPRLYEVKDEKHAEAFWNHESLADEDSLPLGERAEALGHHLQTSARNNIKFGPGGSREISFNTRSSANYKEDGDDKDMQPEKRRGIQLSYNSLSWWCLYNEIILGNVAVGILEGAYYLIGDLVAAEKPNPTIFLKACELLKVKPEAAVHVGDDRRNDIWLWGSDRRSRLLQGGGTEDRCARLREFFLHDNL
ncbi:hypothetical protein SADUNF_Sadunf16G0034600 [Salix dunnii]|uniref:Haloacid dehalogenase-like hydrolase superfamily protein n=1 Tax=Salix dunnii TaxID=1413687 RepID=A0A835J8Z3_9ROSI|nr:hypothetical protein SADUNF_Sadunf16G0034600 [Salix dunnii]